MAHMKKVFLKKLTKYEKAQCKLFADHSAETHIDEYKRRGQEDIDKIKQDIYHGKIGEMMVYNYMISDGIKDVSPIDLNIYEHAKKSYDADFRVGAHNVHVKTTLSIIISRLVGCSKRMIRSLRTRLTRRFYSYVS